jgi:hypothetical protein
VFSAQEVQRALGVSHGAFLDTAEKLQRSQQLISPRRTTALEKVVSRLVGRISNTDGTRPG